MSSLDALFGAEGGMAPPAADPLAALMGGAEPPPEQAPPADSGNAEIEALQTMISMGRDYTDLPTVTEQERVQMEKCLTIFQQLLASNEQMSDQISGASPALRKAFGA